MTLLAAILMVACNGATPDSAATGNTTGNHLDHKTSQPSSATKILVRIKPGVDSASLHTTLGASVERRFSSVEGLELVVLPEGISLQEALTYYNQHPDVDYAEAEQTYKTQ